MATRKKNPNLLEIELFLRLTVCEKKLYNRSFMSTNIDFNLFIHLFQHVYLSG